MRRLLVVAAAMLVAASACQKVGSAPPVKRGRSMADSAEQEMLHVRSLLTAVFGSLPAGEYQVWADDVTPGPVVSVPDGGVAEARLG